MFDFKKNSELAGTFLGIIAVVLLFLVVTDIVLFGIFYFISFGFIDSTGPILNFFIYTFPKVGFKVSLYCAVVSMILLIAVFLRGNEKKKILIRIIPSIGVIIAHIAFGIFMTSYKNVGKQQYQDYLAESIERSFSCDPEVCENLSFSKEENILSFTLINSEKQPIVLTSLYETGSCAGGQLQEIKTERMVAPKQNLGNAFSINLNVGERAFVKIKCAGVVPDQTGFFGGQVGFKFNTSNYSDRNFHVYYSGPRL